MPDIEAVYELEDGFGNADADEFEPVEPSKVSANANGGMNRLEIRHAIEARREERRLARELDSIEFDMD